MAYSKRTFRREERVGEMAKSESGQSDNFIYVGHLQSEIFALNTEDRVISRIEVDEALPTDIPIYAPFTGVARKKNIIGDPSRPELIAFERIEPSSSKPSKSKIIHTLEELDVSGANALLGSLGPSVPYSQLDGNRPSTTIVDVRKKFALGIDPKSGRITATYPLGSIVINTPIRDPRVVACFPRDIELIDRSKEIAEILGYSPAFLLVALARVYKGYCKKVAVAALPEP